ncbi:uncharacterized protein UTRI_01724_B [Ustilago trichophora]|uniref:CCHC-type domain-containing protein n=1 Tax=Ustilago trichophora TaxID=86804 RepID=A0A5C3E2M1_9BASI|nr:uncharacterized protein UTRI_01724_B [Ustilago trichophora]
MGLFTGTSSTSRRPASSVPLKRRSLGRSRDIASSSAASSNTGTSTASEPSPNGPSSSSTARVQSELPRTPSSSSSSDNPTSSHSASRPCPDEDEPEELDLADLQSDNAFLYDRQAPLDSALGLSPVHPPELSLLERIDAYITEHYLECFGVTHQNELVRHHNRLVPFHSKAPRFLSIHSLKRKDLERDFTHVLDTSETCIWWMVKEMGSPAPSERSLESGEWNDEDQSFYFDTHPTPFEAFDPDQSFEGYRYIFSRPRPDDAFSAVDPLGSPTAIDHEESKGDARQNQQKQPLERSCFNCGETDHAVTQCPYPRDRERIRQSRLEFQEKKEELGEDGGIGEINGHARLHEQVASAEQRLRWLDEFVPGKPSRALIEALARDPNEEQQAGQYDRYSIPHDKDAHSTVDLPYLHRMLIWGYPPGYISSQDPIVQIKQRIQRDSEWDSVEVLGGFDVVALEQKDRPEKPPDKTHTAAAAAGYGWNGTAGNEEKRWVDYHTHLFDSYRLQSYDTVFRGPVPQMQRETYPSQRDQRYERHRSPSSLGMAQGWAERPTKRRRRDDEQDDRAALWKRLLSERSPSPPRHQRFDGPQKPVRLGLDPQSPPQQTPPPPPLESPPPPPPPLEPPPPPPPIPPFAHIM